MRISSPENFLWNFWRRREREFYLGLRRCFAVILGYVVEVLNTEFVTVSLSLIF